MATGKPTKYEEYVRYAEHFLEVVRLAKSRESRVIQRHVASGKRLEFGVVRSPGS